MLNKKKVNRVNELMKMKRLKVRTKEKGFRPYKKIQLSFSPSLNF